MTIDETNLPDDADALIAEIARRIDRAPAELVGPRKFEELVEGRRIVARRLAAAGWSHRRIARKLHKDNSTIWSLLHPGAKKVSRTSGTTVTPPGLP